MIYLLQHALFHVKFDNLSFKPQDTTMSNYYTKLKDFSFSLSKVASTSLRFNLHDIIST